MKIGEVIIVVFITVALTLGSIWGYNLHQEAKNPQLHVQKVAQELLADLKALNEGIADLQAYQDKHGIKHAKQIAVIVPESMLKPKMPTLPKVATTAGVQK